MSLQSKKLKKKLFERTWVGSGSSGGLNTKIKKKLTTDVIWHLTEARLNASMAVVVSKTCLYNLYLLNNPSPPLQWFFERPRIHRATHILIFISWELFAETTLIVFAIVFPSVNTGALSHDERINLADKKYATKEHRRKKIMDSIQNAQW